MKAYVIKRDDGMYFSIASHNYERYWGSSLLYCYHFMDFTQADTFLKDQIEIEENVCCKMFENCKVVPVEIKECEDE